MGKIILIRIGELFLKGKNRGIFERQLFNNIKSKLSVFDCKVLFERNRYIIADFNDNILNDIINALKTVFGINSLSVGVKVPSNMADIFTASNKMIKKGCTFRITANRGDKTFKLNSMELAMELGGMILTTNKTVKVDLHNPDININVDVREEGYTYIFENRILGLGGMPAGSSGKGMLLLSGGIDSPVAGFLMAKRGLSLNAIHFHSYPYTSENAQKKVIELRDNLQNYCGNISLNMVGFTKVQEAINKYCTDSFMITILRRQMLRAAERVALAQNCSCIISGESLAQVASQTVESITATNSVITSLPVFRPLISFDKQEIVQKAIDIGSYEISIKPFEDCCTVFLPPKPIIKPKLKQCEYEESRIKNLDELLCEAIDKFEIV